MVDHDIRRIENAWHEAVSKQGRSLPLGVELPRALAFIPGAVAWAISDDARSAFVLGPDDVMFTATVEDDGALSVTSEPLQADRMIMSLEVGEPRKTETGGVLRRNQWWFRYANGRDDPRPWQHIAGTVRLLSPDIERYDNAETVARAIASKVGWAVAPPVE